MPGRPPLVLAWELTRACPLACRHCRAAARTARSGACEFRAVCGGCRARAYAATGDPLGEEPDCAYEPAGVLVTAARVTPRSAALGR